MSKLETNTIDTLSGTSTLQVGSTNTSTITLGVSGDTVNVPSGVTIANSGTATGFGGTNTPNFLVAKSGNQTLSSGTVTKISLGTEEYDSDNVFGSDKFTVPSGQGGKYNLFGNVQLQSDGTNKLLNAVVYIYINGSESSSQISRVSELYDSNDITRASMNFSFAINLSASDYVEIYASATHSTGGSIFARQESTYFGAYKIIE